MLQRVIGAESLFAEVRRLLPFAAGTGEEGRADIGPSGGYKVPSRWLLTRSLSASACSWPVGHASYDLGGIRGAICKSLLGKRPVYVPQ
jgi:hypothetical protein